MSVNGILSGKTAIVTGSGQGIGRGIALALAMEGANVVVCDRFEERVNAACAAITERTGTALGVVCDVTSLADLQALVDRTVEAFGTVDILVNNAMQVPQGSVLDIDEDVVDAGWRSGPLATFRLMRLCHEHLRDGGAVVNVSSGAALATHPSQALYAAMKAAISVISRSAAVEWGSDGIRVNTIMPFSETPTFKVWAEADPVFSAKAIAEVPLQRIGDSERDIGRGVVFLVGPDASYITGTTLPVDGGRAYLR